MYLILYQSASVAEFIMQSSINSFDLFHLAMYNLEVRTFFLLDSEFVPRCWKEISKGR